MHCTWILAGALAATGSAAEGAPSGEDRAAEGTPGAATDTPVGETPPASQDELPRLLVLALNLDSAVRPETGRQLENLLVTHLKAIGRHQVMSQADVVTLLGVEQQKQLTGCEGDSCMAEIGGALGAQWMVSGTVGALGSRRIITLKLLDVNAALIENQLSKELPDADDDLVEAMRELSYEVLRLEAPVLVQPWYKRWWVWTLAGAVVVGGVTAGVVAGVVTSAPPGSNLGIIEW